MSFNIGEGERNYSQFFFKKDIFGTGKCPSQSDVRLTESQIKGVSKYNDQL